MLNDTPFGNDEVIQKHIDAGISLCDAVNFIVEKYDLVRTDRHGFSVKEQSPFLLWAELIIRSEYSACPSNCSLTIVSH